MKKLLLFGVLFVLTTHGSAFGAGDLIVNGIIKTKILNCDSLDTDGSGNIICGIDESGTGGAFTDDGTFASYTGGKVGIGTTVPTEALDVTGNIKASGTICDGNGCIGAGGAFIEGGFASPVTWTNLVGVSVTDNDVTKTASNGWGSAGTFSAESLTGDGYIEFRCSTENPGVEVGLSSQDTDQSWDTIEFGINCNSTPAINITESGSYRVVDPVFEMNDLFRIKVASNVVSYYKNGSLLYTSNVTPTFPLYIDTALSLNNSQILDIVMYSGGAEGPLAYYNNGNVGIGTATPSEALDVVGTVQATAFVGDGSGLTNISSVALPANIAYKTSDVDQTFDGGTLHIDAINNQVGIGTTTPVEALDVSGAVRATAFIGDGSGLSNLPSSGVFTDHGTFASYTGGNVGIGTVGPTEALDVNGNIKASGTICDGNGCIGGGGAFVELGDSGGVATPVTWTNLIGVSVTDNDVTKTAANGWGSAGTFSAESLTGDGYIEFRCVLPNSTVVVGLSSQDTNQDNTVEYGIFCHRGSSLMIYESGAYVNTFGTFETNDLFRVEVASNVVSYYKNGAPFYTSTVTPSFPLYIDTALNLNNSQILDVVMNNGGSEGPVAYYNNGNVGIGTTMPTEVLDVVGTVKAAAFIGNGSGLTNLLSSGTFINGGTFASYTSGNIGIGMATPRDSYQMSIMGSTVAEELGVDYQRGLSIEVEPDSSLWTQTENHVSAIDADVVADDKLGDESLETQVGINIQYGAGSTASPISEVQNAFGLKIDPNHEGGQIDKSYGIYINTPLLGGAVNNYWALYQADTGTINYFAGNVGIGTDQPTSKLEVSGDITVSGEVYSNSGLLSSDFRYKKNVHKLSDALEQIIKLRGVSYEWKVEEFPHKKFDKKHQVGFIAQELEEVVPELVYTGKDGYKAVDYARLMPIVVEAIKAQQKEIEKLKAENASIKAKNVSMEERLSQMEMLKLRMAQIEATLAKYGAIATIHGKATNE